jgi:quercetin dioxygenase-like cupin family protein
MTMQDNKRTSGVTTATSERPSQQMAAPVLTFRLTKEVEQLHGEGAWRSSDRNTKALVHHSHLRVLLTTLKAGARINEHQADGPITIHTLNGKLRLHVGTETHDIAAGEILILDRALAHDVEALEDSSFLLTVVWPEDKRST